MEKVGRFCVTGLLVILVVGAACTGSAKETDLEGTRWFFDANHFGDVRVKASGDELLTLEFKDGRFNGYAGCNSFFGSYTQEGGKLSFGSVNTSLKICVGNRQHQEDVILQALEQVSAFEFDGTFLQMETGESSSIIYRKDTRHGQIIDHGGLHTFETCQSAGGVLNASQTTCTINEWVYEK